MDYIKMSPLLVEVAKKQQEFIEALQKQVARLTKENEQIKALASKVA